MQSAAPLDSALKIGLTLGLIFMLIRLFWTRLRLWLRIRQLLRNEDYWVKGEGCPSSSEVLISVIIPARNEEDNIEACLRRVFAQTYRNLEIIVVDDDSTDETAAILRRFTDPRLVIISGDQALPSDWKGKTWACQRAIDASQGEWLVFIDADVRLQPNAVAASIAYAEAKNLDLLTGLDRHILVSFGERTLHAYNLYDMGFTRNWIAINDPERHQTAGNGRFLVFRRTAVLASHVFHHVANKIVEDEAIGAFMKRHRFRTCAAILFDIVEVRMYRSTIDTYRGWRKTIAGGIIDACNGIPGYQTFVILLAVMIGGALIKLMPYVVVLSGAVSLIPPWLVVFALPIIVIEVRSRLEFARSMRINPLLDLLCHVPGICFSICMMIIGLVGSIQRGTVTWKGRALVK